MTSKRRAARDRKSMRATRGSPARHWLDLDRAHLAVEVDRDFLGVAELVCARQRARDALRCPSAAIVRLARVTTTSLKPAGVDADQPVGAHRFDDTASTGTVPVCAEIGRAEHRRVGGDAGVLDQIADAHDVAA